MPVGDTFQLRMGTQFLLQTCYNVFHYQNTVVDGDPNDLNTAFITAIAPPLAAVQSIYVLGVDLYTFNLQDEDEFETDPITGYAGAVGGDVLPCFASWGFQYTRTLRTTHNGAKRFPGVPESLQVNGVATGAAITALNTLGTALFTPLVGASGAHYLPVILHRPTVAHPIQTVQAIAAVVYKRITTQNSRKIGRGA